MSILLIIGLLGVVLISGYFLYAHYNNQLTLKNLELKSSNKNLSLEYQRLLNEIQILQAKRKTISDLIAENEQSVQTLYDKQLETAREKLEIKISQLRNSFENQKKQYEMNFELLLQKHTDCFTEKLHQLQEDTEAQEATLLGLKQTIDTIIAANIRNEEKKNKIKFYTLSLSETDIQEIEKIKSISSYLRNSRPLYKAIWENYYRNPTTDLIGRIIKGKTGIYKITCLLDNKIYIGQAVDMAERIKQHIKCGIGLDSPKNKLYTAMQEKGVNNFTFEIMEECPVILLNEKEKYWINFYQSHVYGYNMTSGNSTEVKQ